MEFENFDQFNQQFRDGKFDVSDRKVTIDGLEYNLLSSSQHKWEEIMEGKPGVIIYSTGKPRKDQAIEKGMDEWLALIWLAKGNTVVPVEVRPTTSARMGFQLGGKADKEPDTEKDRRPSVPRARQFGENAEPNTIGDTVRLKITNLPASNELKGKVDTGATVSSLHAEKWNIEGDQVKFVCPELSPNVISMPLVDQQAVKSSDGGVEYRPVIELNVKINDKVMQGVQFNLNDRGQMEFPVLIGQNILEKGKYLIDPTINEEVTIIDEGDDIDWDALFENLGPIELPQEEDSTDSAVIAEVYEILRKSDVKFGDLIRHMRTDITESLDDIKY
jgi:hypothetical protein